MIVKKNEEDKYDHLIAQSKNGSGKTGAFVIGSLLRVDPSNPKVQVIVLGHTRELVNQIYSVYASAAKYTEIVVKNIVDETSKPQAHVMITTLNKIVSLLSGRNKLDFSNLRVVIIDEADVFFEQMKDIQQLQKL